MAAAGAGRVLPENAAPRPGEEASAPEAQEVGRELGVYGAETGDFFKLRGDYQLEDEADEVI